MFVGNLYEINQRNTLSGYAKSLTISTNSISIVTDGQTEKVSYIEASEQKLLPNKRWFLKQENIINWPNNFEI